MGQGDDDGGPSRDPIVKLSYLIMKCQVNVQHGFYIYFIFQDDDLDETVKLNNSIKSMHTPSSTEESSESESESSESEDDVSKLASKKDKLSNELRKTKKLLADATREFTLANNVRVAQSKELQKLKDTIEAQKKEIDTLRQKNFNLQDLVSAKFGKFLRF